MSNARRSDFSYGQRAILIGDEYKTASSTRYPESHWIPRSVVRSNFTLSLCCYERLHFCWQFAGWTVERFRTSLDTLSEEPAVMRHANRCFNEFYRFRRAKENFVLFTECTQWERRKSACALTGKIEIFARLPCTEVDILGLLEISLPVVPNWSSWWAPEFTPAPPRPSRSCHISENTHFPDTRTHRIIHLHSSGAIFTVYWLFCT